MPSKELALCFAVELACCSGLIFLEWTRHQPDQSCSIKPRFPCQLLCDCEGLSCGSGCETADCCRVKRPNKQGRSMNWQGLAHTLKAICSCNNKLNCKLKLNQQRRSSTIVNNSTATRRRANISQSHVEQPSRRGHGSPPGTPRVHLMPFRPDTGVVAPQCVAVAR